MSFLCIDTETNGLPVFKDKETGLPIPADDPRQPRLAHLAMIRLDAAGTEQDRTDLYVRPDGWTMPQGEGTAGAVNGLTDEFLTSVGMDIAEVLKAYSREIERGRVVVAFNAQFDCKVMRGELRRAGMPDLFQQTKNICVMRPMTAICRIPNANRGGLKFPNLGEALAHFGHTIKDAHKAMSDAEGAATIFRELMARGLLPEASVHYAKEPKAAKPKAAKKKPAKRQVGPAFDGGLF